MTRASPLYSDRRCNVRRWVSGFKTMFAWPPGLIAGRFLFSGGGEWGLGKKASGQRNNSANESRHRAEDQHHVPFGCHLLRALVDRRQRHANICERLLALINAGARKSGVEGKSVARSVELGG